jgi:hypothetical protein
MKSRRVEIGFRTALKKVLGHGLQLFMHRLPLLASGLRVQVVLILEATVHEGLHTFHLVQLAEDAHHGLVGEECLKNP